MSDRLNSDSSDGTRFGVLMKMCFEKCGATSGGFRSQDLVDSSTLLCVILHMNISLFGFVLHNCALFDF